MSEKNISQIYFFSKNKLREQLITIGCNYSKGRLKSANSAPLIDKRGQ